MKKFTAWGIDHCTKVIAKLNQEKSKESDSYIIELIDSMISEWAEALENYRELAENK